jgi:hypothetical protein
MANVELPPLLKKVVDWLRAGYPEGVPDVDYLPLFALSSSDPQSAEAIKAAITAVTNTKPNEADVNRVRARLAGGGWPLAKPHHL